MKKKLSLFCMVLMSFLVFPFLSFAGEATVSWQANTESDLEGYRVYYGTEPGSYGPFVPAGNNTSKTITDLDDGETYYFVVTAVDQAGNESGYSSPPASKTIEPSTPTAVSVTPSVLSPQSVGTPVTLGAEASGGSGNYEYKYWIRNQAGYWKCVQEYSTSNSYTWDTTNYAGTNLIQVWARNSGSSASYEVYCRAFTYEITGGMNLPTSVGVLGSIASPQPVGTPVTLDAEASGGSGNYEYKYWIRNQAGYWKCVQEYSTSNSYAWDTTNYAGTNLIQVWARNVGSSASYEAYSTVFSYEVTGGLSLPTSVSVLANIASPQSAGTTVTLTAQADGGSGSYEYRYWVKKSDGVWECIQDYSPSSTCAWNTTDFPGTNLIHVWARNVGSSALYEVASQVNLTYMIN